MDKNRNISGKKLGLYVATLGVAIPAVIYPLTSLPGVGIHLPRFIIKKLQYLPLPMFFEMQKIAGIPFSYFLSAGVLIFFIGIALIIRNFNPATIKDHARLEGAIHGEMGRSEKMIQLEELAADFKKNLKQKYELEMLKAVEEGDVETYSEIKKQLDELEHPAKDIEKPVL